MSVTSSPPTSPAPQPAVSSLPTLARLAGRFRPVALWSAGVLVVLLLRSVLEVSFSYIVGWTLDSLAPVAGRGHAVPEEFELLLWLFAGTLVARNVVTYAAAVVSMSLGQELENRFRTELFVKVSHLHFRYHDANRSGKTIARSLRDMEKAKRFFREVAFGYLEVALIAVGIVVMSFFVHWTYGVLTLMTVAIATGLAFRVGAEIAARDRAVGDDYDVVTTVLQENVAGARVVRAFGREPEEMGKFGGRLSRFTGGWRGVARYWTARMPTIHAIYNLAIPATLLIGVTRAIDGVGTVGEVATILLYIGLMKNRMRPLTRMIISGQEAVASATRVFEVLDHEEEIRAPARPSHLPAHGGDLVIENVHFGHRADVGVLRGVDLHVPAGSSLGIIGVTGAGKSTLVSLLPRYYDPDEGRILLDGIDLRELDPAELRRTVGLVFQEPFLFSASVEENLRYGRPDATRSEIVDAARQAAAHDFVSRLPAGYETMVGERGVSLSGGQRQRLTIARALVMHPRVLVFDDATAAVDAITEKRLFEGIRSAAVGRTAIIISQRVTSVRWCDRIAVLEDGRIQDIGTHDELLGRNALYREIATHQSLVAAGGAS